MFFLQSGKNQVKFNEIKDISIRDFSNSDFIANSSVMKNLNKKIEDLASLSSFVLILGEKGTGRKTTAFEIFKRENRTSDFLTLNCYNSTDYTIQNRLFGEKSFLKISAENTLFIKGIDRLNLNLQKQLLQYLKDPKNKTSLPRLLCASSEKKIYSKIQKNLFSLTLFKILSENIMTIPSLNQRKEDIPFFISRFNKKNEFKVDIDEEALKVLKSHSWKENIKELRNVCFQLSVLYPDKKLITTKELTILKPKTFNIKNHMEYNPKVTLDTLINQYIQLSLEHFKSKKRSAKALGISAKTIYNKIKSGHLIDIDSRP